jgi:hypothetical protein
VLATVGAIQQVALVVNATERFFNVVPGQELVKSMAIKGLVGPLLPIGECAFPVWEEARSDYLRCLEQHRGRRQRSLWAR